MGNNVSQQLADVFVLDAPGASSDSQFTWTDANGNTHYVSHKVQPLSIVDALSNKLPLIKKNEAGTNNPAVIDARLKTIFAAEPAGTSKSEKYNWSDENKNRHDAEHTVTPGTVQVKEHMSDANSMAKLIDLVRESPLKVLMWLIITFVIIYLVSLFITN
jgi:hypothetical protein